MTERILLSVISLVMFWFTIKHNEKFLSFIVTFLTIGVLLSLFRIGNIPLIGIFIFFLTSIAVSIYGICIKVSSKFDRITIIVSGVLLTIILAFQINHWPYGSLIKLFAIVPIILYLISFLKGLNSKSYFGMLTIVACYFLIQLLNLRFDF